jgi:multidrug resistance efflux pump
MSSDSILKVGDAAAHPSHSETSTDALGEAQFFLDWLGQQCGIVGDVARAVLVMGPPATGPFLPVAFWPRGESASALLAEVAELALKERQPGLLQRATHSAIAYPILVDGHIQGLVALECGVRSDAEMKHVLQQLQWGVEGVIANQLRQQNARDQMTSERLMATLDLVASTLTEQSFAGAAHTLVTDLAIRFGCDRVSIGLRQGAFVRVEAVSHSAQIGNRMNLIHAVESAMDESIDQKSLILFPITGDQVLVVRDHAALSRQHGSDCLLTVPFVSNRLVAGAFTLERSGTRPFTAQEVELCQAIAALSSRILEDKRLNDRLLPWRVKDAVVEELGKIVGPTHFGRKVAAFALMFTALFFSFANGTYTVGANAALEGSIRRVLVAPYDGYVESTSQRAGDVVKSGALLASLDQRDLQLEYLRWQSQADQFAKQSQEALAKSDRVQVSIIQAQMQQAKAQMSLLAEQLARARISAPFDGVVVSGDLSQALGSSVKRGQMLFEIAPLNAYRVILEVDESDIASVREGQTGKLVLTALPGETFPLVVGHLTPVTNSREGRSYYRVEASVGQVSERLRPGMEGVGKIEIGERKLLWQWTHKLVNWVRLTVWSWI